MQNKARMLFKKLKAGIITWDKLSDEELELMFKHYPNLFPCEYTKDSFACGEIASVIIIATKDNDTIKIPACKTHKIKLSIYYLHRGYTVRWVKRW